LLAYSNLIDHLIGLESWYRPVAVKSPPLRPETRLCIDIPIGLPTGPDTAQDGVTGAIIASIIERAGHAAVRRVGDSTEVRLTRADFRVSIDAVCREAGARDTEPRAYQ